MVVLMPHAHDQRALLRNPFQRFLLCGGLKFEFGNQEIVLSYRAPCRVVCSFDMCVRVLYPTFLEFSQVSGKSNHATRRLNLGGRVGKGF